MAPHLSGTRGRDYRNLASINTIYTIVLKLNTSLHIRTIRLILFRPLISDDSYDTGSERMFSKEIGRLMIRALTISKLDFVLALSPLLGGEIPLFVYIR